jgi:MoaD family protein
MLITVEYFAQAREAAGRAREQVELAAPGTVAALVERLAGDHGGRLAGLLLGGAGRPAPSVLVAVGGRQVHPDAAAELHDGDEVLVVPAVSGG